MFKWFSHSSRVLGWPRLLLLAAAAAGLGCSSLRKYKVVPESVAACRKLSQEGAAALEQGDSARARALLAEAVEHSPADVDARRQLAEAYWRDQHFVDAARHIEVAIALDPSHGPTLVRAGEMVLALDRIDDAYRLAGEAIALDGTLAAAWALRGEVHRRRGEFAAALADLHQALRFQPTSIEVLTSEAELQFQLGRPQRCLTTLHHLLDVFPPGEEPQRLLWLEGLAYATVDRHDDAAESLWAAAQRGSAPAELLYQLAKAEHTAGRSDAATAAARRALEADAEHEGSRQLLALLKSPVPAPAEIFRR